MRLFFFKGSTATEISTYGKPLSLHDALPSWSWGSPGRQSTWSTPAADLAPAPDLAPAADLVPGPARRLRREPSGEGTQTGPADQRRGHGYAGAGPKIGRAHV